MEKKIFTNYYMLLSDREFREQSEDPFVILTEFAVKHDLSQLEALTIIIKELNINVE